MVLEPAYLNLWVMNSCAHVHIHADLSLQTRVPHESCGAKERHVTLSVAEILALLFILSLRIFSK